MAITASAVQELRKITNAGMMACKKALTETDGDMDTAVKLLREKGIVKSAGRSDRETSEGPIAQSDTADAESAVGLAYGDGTIQDALGAKFSELGEVIKVKRITRYSAEGNGAISSYIHMGGKVGVLLELSAENAGTKDSETFKGLSRDICLHIAALNPSGLTRDDIDASTIEEENEINRKQLEAEGKPAEIIEKILIGKINKYFSESCLIDQAFVKDDKVSVKQHVAAQSKEIGDNINIVRFARFNVGA